jgi:hypothetical protein
VRATLVQYKEFQESFVYRDIKDILLRRLALVRDDLEGQQFKTLDEQTMSDLINKGRAEELRYISVMVEDIINNWDEYTKQAEVIRLLIR